MARIPEFVVGDEAKPLRRVVQDEDGNVVDLSDPGVEVRLFAIGIDNSDRPTSDEEEEVWNGVLGALVNDGTDGTVDFEAMGELIDIGTVRSAQLYRYRIQVKDADGKIVWYPEAYFIARRAPQPAEAP